MVYYIYEVSWNETPETEKFENFDEARAYVDQMWAKEDPNYVTPFITEIELVEQEDGTSLPTGNDEIVWSYDSGDDNVKLSQPKLFDDSEYEGKLAYDPAFDIYPEFDVEEKDDAPKPEQLAFDFDEDFDEIEDTVRRWDSDRPRPATVPDDTEPAEAIEDTVDSWGDDVQIPEPTKDKKATRAAKRAEKRAGKIISKWDEALDALNEADECEVECTSCHEMFPKDECLKECGKFICKECASKKSLNEDAGDVPAIIQHIVDSWSLDDVEESLEDTVPEDLSDDRTPIQGDVHVLDEPVDYKDEVAKEKLVDEAFNGDEFKRYMAAAEKLGLKTGADLMKFSEEHGGVKDKELLKVLEAEANKEENLTEDVLTEAPFDGRKRVAKYFDNLKSKYVVVGKNKSVECNSFKEAEGKAKSLSAQNAGEKFLIKVKKDDTNALDNDLNLVNWQNGKETVNNFKTALAAIQGMKQANKNAVNDQADQSVEDPSEGSEDSADDGAKDTGGAAGSDAEKASSEDAGAADSGADAGEKKDQILARTLSKEEMQKLLTGIAHQLKADANIKLETNQLENLGNLMISALEKTFGDDIFLTDEELDAKIKAAEDEAARLKGIKDGTSQEEKPEEKPEEENKENTKENKADNAEENKEEAPAENNAEESNEATAETNDAEAAK